MTVSRFAFSAMLIFNIILALSVINLEFFAKQGARYTADDGARERAERLHGDNELRDRMDELCLKN